MTLRSRLDRLEKNDRPRVTFWDALVGAADPADLSADDRAVYDELTAPAGDAEPDPVEAMLNSLAASAGEPDGPHNTEVER